MFVGSFLAFSRERNTDRNGGRVEILGVSFALLSMMVTVIDMELYIGDTLRYMIRMK